MFWTAIKLAVVVAGVCFFVGLALVSSFSMSNRNTARECAGKPRHVVVHEGPRARCVPRRPVR